jgi:20S proteasome alpha/beta subunit
MSRKIENRTERGDFCHGIEKNIPSYDYNSFYKRQKLFEIVNWRKKDMTYILGAKCSDGVVLVGDTKITIDNGADYAYSKKLFKPFNSVVMGASGLSGLYKSFQDRMTLAVTDYESKVGPINRNDALSVVAEGVIRSMHDIYKEDRFLITMNLNVLMATRIGIGSELRFFTGQGIPEPINEIKVIGHGEPYGAIFLKNMWRPSMTMEQTAKLALFILRVIQDNNPPLDNSVGFTNQILPQVYYLPDIKLPPIMHEKINRNMQLNQKELEDVDKVISNTPIKELNDVEVRHLLDEVSSNKAHLDTIFKTGQFKI